MRGLPVLLLLSAFSASAQEPKSLVLSGRAFPTYALHLGVPAPDRRPVDAAQILFEVPVDPAFQAALEAQKAAGAEAPAASAPVAEIPAQVVPFDRQTEPSQGILWLFLVDASKSMATNNKEPVARARNAIGALTALMRPHDTVMLIRFWDTTEVVVGPTHNRGEILNYLNDFQLPGETTKLFDAIDQAMHVDLARFEGRPDFPSVPGRRLAFVFSDGVDEKSAVNAEGLVNVKLKQRAEAGAPLEVWTVGVGREKTNDHNDLERLGRLVAATGQERFFEGPSSDGLVKSVRTHVEGLGQQVLFRFELPAEHWGAAEVPATLRYTSAGRGEERLALRIPVSNLTPEQAAQATEVIAARKALVEWHLGRQKTQAWLVYGGIGLGGVVLLGLGFITFRRRARAVDARMTAMRADLAQQQQQVLHGLDDLEASQRVAARQIHEQNRHALASLFAVSGPMLGQRFALLKAHVVAGRDPDCDLVFPAESDVGISRRHLEFRLEGTDWKVGCLSQGGAQINTTRLNFGDHYPVRLGDHLTLGQSTFRLDAAV